MSCILNPMHEINKEQNVSMPFTVTFGRTGAVPKISQWNKNEFIDYKYLCNFSINHDPETETIILDCLIGYEMLIVKSRSKK